MQKILFYIRVSLPKCFTRKQFNAVIREYSYTSHPEHHLQRLVEKGKLKRLGEGKYQLI